MGALVGLLGALGSIAGFLKLALDWLNGQEQQQAGADIEAGAVAQTTAKTEIRIAQAAASAPKTQSAVAAAWQAGNV